MTPPDSGSTSTSNYPGLLTPSWRKEAVARGLMKPREKPRDRLKVEKRKVEARKKGQLRALTRL